jgi:hypothetical protein
VAKSVRSEQEGVLASRLAWPLCNVDMLKADSHIACRAHAVPLPCRAVNSHMPCHAPALLRQCRVLRESPHGSRKYPNC